MVFLLQMLTPADRDGYKFTDFADIINGQPLIIEDIKEKRFEN